MTQPNLLVDVDRGTLTLGEHRSFVAKAIAMEVLRLQGGTEKLDSRGVEPRHMSMSSNLLTPPIEVPQ